MNKNYPTRYHRQDEWSPFVNLRHEVDRLFDDFWGGSSELSAQEGQWYPVCDVTEDKDHFMVTLETAGIPKEDIKIEVLNNNLVISGERKLEEKRKEKGVMYSERRFGRFQRSFSLPPGLKTEQIEAAYEDGVLNVMIPKAEEERPRQVKISGGGQKTIQASGKPIEKH